MLHTAQRFATAIQQVNYPVHQGRPNPMHGKFFCVGSIPATCWNPDRDNGPFSPKGGARFFDTEGAAIRAAIEGGATYIQGADCRKIDIEAFKADAEERAKVLGFESDAQARQEEEASWRRSPEFRAWMTREFPLRAKVLQAATGVA